MCKHYQKSVFLLIYFPFYHWYCLINKHINTYKWLLLYLICSDQISLTITFLLIISWYPGIVGWGGVPHPPTKLVLTGLSWGWFCPVMVDSLSGFPASGMVSTMLHNINIYFITLDLRKINISWLAWYCKTSGDKEKCMAIWNLGFIDLCLSLSMERLFWYRWIVLSFCNIKRNFVQIISLLK